MVNIFLQSIDLGYLEGRYLQVLNIYLIYRDQEENVYHFLVGCHFTMKVWFSTKSSLEVHIGGVITPHKVSKFMWKSFCKKIQGFSNHYELGYLEVQEWNTLSRSILHPLIGIYAILRTSSLLRGQKFEVKRTIGYRRVQAMGFFGWCIIGKSRICGTSRRFIDLISLFLLISKIIYGTNIGKNSLSSHPSSK